MSLSTQFALAAARFLQERTQAYGSRALRVARHGAVRAVERMEAEGPRISALAEAGLKASEASFRGLDRLVRHGLASAKGALDDGAERLRLTARSETFAELYDAQRATLPASRARIAKELEAAWAIVLLTGQELAGVARSAREDLAQSRQQPSHARARKPRAKRATRRRAALPHSP
ncbi:MAG TPA: hypothetical protein VMU40_02550 [Steroidobacteraceae bacterium]|nr:hypothetical protein [Steroidobacteraceae bacterium]